MNALQLIIYHTPDYFEHLNDVYKSAADASLEYS